MQRGHSARKKDIRFVIKHAIQLKFLFTSYLQTGHINHFVSLVLPQSLRQTF